MMHLGPTSLRRGSLLLAFVHLLGLPAPAGGDARTAGPVARAHALQFTVLPTAVVAPATFDVTVTIVDSVSGTPQVPASPVTITLATQGTGTLVGTTVLTTSTANATFVGLGYQGLEQAALIASSPGLPSETSPLIDFDEPNCDVEVDSNPLVNRPFDLKVDFSSKLHPGQPVSVTSLPLTLSQRDGAGTLSGTGGYTASGTTITLANLTYDAWDTTVAVLRTAYSSAVRPLRAALALTAPAPGTTLFVPPSLAQPTTITVRDGLGAPFVVTEAFDWTVTNGTTFTQQGTVAVTAASTFAAPVPALAAGSYKLRLFAKTRKTLAFSLPIEMLTEAPGPVLRLRPGRVGTPYDDTVAGIVTGTVSSYFVATGVLPAGLSLHPTSGAVTGTPAAVGTARLQVIARVGTTNKPLRVTISVFSAAETEFVAGQNFGFTGATPPYTSASVDQTVTPGSTFDLGNPAFPIRVHYPSQIASITQPMPLLVYQHGRGFDHTEYNDVLGRVARWGFVCVSSGDYYSFYGNSQPGYAGSQPYETSYTWSGMESASGTMERLLRHMVVRNRTPGDVFFGKIDESRLFHAGHSRGGGAMHASQSRGFNLRLAASSPYIPATEYTGLAGYVGLMPFDLWYSSTCQPPNIPTVPAGLGATPYNIPRDQRRIPGLIFASELDGDLVYPICDQMIERRTTSTCFLTIWGGNHNQTGDAHANDATPSITAATQRNILVQWMTAFLLRFGYDRLDLEGHLFGDEYTKSSHVGHLGYRDLSTQVMVLDAQNNNPALNNLSLANFASAGVTAAIANPYPTSGSLANATPRSLRVLFTTIGAGKTFRTTLSAVGLDVQTKKRLVFEIRQSGTTGFGWCSIGVRVTDIAGASALVSVYDRLTLPNTSAFLPVYPIPGHSTARPLNRFLQVDIPLSQFAGVNLAQLASVTFEFDNANTTNNLLIDDLRIE